MMRSKADEAKVSIEVKVKNGIPEILADRDKIKQVIINLISNAIKYNRENGNVVVSVTLNKGLWKFQVADNGFGIPKAAIPNLFKKFYRVGGTEQKISGTGLGLSICKEIVQGHGGSVEIDSKLNQGTKFRFYIPQQGA